MFFNNSGILRVCNKKLKLKKKGLLANNVETCMGTNLPNVFNIISIITYLLT